ncbi:EF-hand domain-containing protein [Acidovorax soli]|uniref:EF hand n=1 Tax=Acidovorax soli TaxID=592050 RepID=A0A1H3XU62_9BURK|nr:EF-hand domain-containing protein [Acidovorax soli]SEA02082.1 EF hand [Acidovorax soli]
MKAIQRRTSAFDARSVLLFAALSLGGTAALQAQTAPATAPKTQGVPSLGPATSSPKPAGPAGMSPSATAAFDRADTNADGKLSPEEAAALPAIGNRFEQLDTDRDGSLSRAEFDKGAKP